MKIELDLPDDLRLAGLHWARRKGGIEWFVAFQDEASLYLGGASGFDPVATVVQAEKNVRHYLETYRPPSQDALRSVNTASMNLTLDDLDLE